MRVIDIHEGVHGQVLKQLFNSGVRVIHLPAVTQRFDLDSLSNTDLMRLYIQNFRGPYPRNRGKLLHALNIFQQSQGGTIPETYDIGEEVTLKSSVHISGNARIRGSLIVRENLTLTVSSVELLDMAIIYGNLFAKGAVLTGLLVLGHAHVADSVIRSSCPVERNARRRAGSQESAQCTLQISSTGRATLVQSFIYSENPLAITPHSMWKNSFGQSFYI